MLARVSGVNDRDQAQALHGTEIYVPRDALPALEEEETFYHADLIGLRAEDTAGRAVGRVTAVENYGAGDILEIALEVTGEITGETAGKGGQSLMLPFTRATVPEVDLAAGRLVVVLPEEAAVPARGGEER